MNLTEISFFDEKFKDLMKKLEEGNLTEKDMQDIESLVRMFESFAKENENYKRKFGSIRDYQDLINQGFTRSEVMNFIRQDDAYVKECEDKLADNIEKREHMFGYPAHMKKDSSTASYLRYLESKAYLMNGCGDPNEQGNYVMDNKVIEKRIVNAIASNIGLDGSWGYITTGGTEGNIWGINYGLSKYPEGILYYSGGTHYSITKANIGSHQTVKINAINDKMDTKELLKQIEINYRTTKKPAVLILNYGTTKMGAVDDISIIKKYLVEHNIPHYIHVDAALYGGIAKNQIDSPYTSFKDIDIDSISISLHKYIGLQECKGVILAKQGNIEKFVDYIGQNDTTICGSRDFPAFSTYQKVNEAMNRQNPKAYVENINFFINLLNQYGINYWRGDPNGNTFIIEKPSDDVCKYYQLATFSSDQGEFAHVIIFSSQDKNVIKQLADTLYQDKKKGNPYVKIPTNKL